MFSGLQYQFLRISFRGERHIGKHQKRVSSVERLTLALAGSPSVMVGSVEGLWMVKLARVPSLSSSFWAWKQQSATIKTLTMHFLHSFSFSIFICTAATTKHKGVARVSTGSSLSEGTDVSVCTMQTCRNPSQRQLIKPEPAPLPGRASSTAGEMQLRGRCGQGRLGVIT